MTDRKCLVQRLVFQSPSTIHRLLTLLFRFLVNSANFTSIEWYKDYKYFSYQKYLFWIRQRTQDSVLWSSRKLSTVKLCNYVNTVLVPLLASLDWWLTPYVFKLKNIFMCLLCCNMKGKIFFFLN